MSHALSTTMISPFPTMALFAFAAVLNSAILGAAIAWRGRGTHVFWLGPMFLGIGFLLAVYTLEAYDRVSVAGWVRVAYDVVALLLSCFLLEYVVGGLRHRRAPLAIYAVVVVYLLLLTTFQGAFLRWLDIDRLVLVQSFYTAAAIGVCLRHDGFPSQKLLRDRAWLHASAITAAFLIIHGAHLARFLAGRAGSSRDLAPLLGIVVLIGLTAYAFTTTRYGAWVPPTRRLAAGESRSLLDALDRVMTERRLFVQADLDLATLARAAGSTPQNVSAALNSGLGKTFYEYVTGFRVEEAKRLLRDPSRDALSLEAIGQDSGFRSRSSFYSSFKSATGQTPGAYRRTAPA